MEELLYKIAFASVRGMTLDLAQKLLEVIPSEKEFFSLSEKELIHITGSHAKMCGNAYRRSLLERAEREMDFIRDKHIGIHYFTDDSYPKRMLEAIDAPLLLYSSGPCNLNEGHIVSIVGTRHATQYGIRVCEDIVKGLNEKLQQVVVISGLAYGIDIAAHRAALKYNVPTVAVLAQGLNKIYPSTHRNDAVNIVRKGGAIVTDYQSQDRIYKGNFLARNRIIAAMSDCTIVVESADKGGALVTASLAQSYNRDVFAIPGRVGDEFSRGCNRLIGSHRAQAITGADDIIDAMRWETANQATPVQGTLFPDFSKEEQAVIDALRNAGEMHINSLTNILQQPVYKLMSILVELDCKGYVITLPGSRYTLR